MGRLQGFGGRTKSVTKLHSGIAQMTAADYVQPKCDHCGHAISDDRMDGRGRPSKFRFCSRNCASTHSQLRRGIGTGLGQPTKWRELYDRAKASPNTWCEARFDSAEQAYAFARSVEYKKAFQSSRDGLTVSIRYVVAA